MSAAENEAQAEARGATVRLKALADAYVVGAIDVDTYAARGLEILKTLSPRARAILGETKDQVAL